MISDKGTEESGRGDHATFGKKGSNRLEDTRLQQLVK